MTRAPSGATEPAADVAADLPPREHALDLLHQMIRIRRFEEKCSPTGPGRPGRAGRFDIHYFFLFPPPLPPLRRRGRWWT
jgi:hypothetical protein